MTSITKNEMKYIAVILALALAGCAQISIHSTVAADGTIEEYRMQINTSRTVYGFLEQSAEDEGYDSLRESFLANIDESRADQVDYDEEFSGDSVSITITMKNFDPPPDSSISITEQDGMLIYEDTIFVNESAQEGEESELAQSITAGLSVDYYLAMPGEIVDSNANEVDGDTAEWHEFGKDAFIDNRIYAKSEVSTGIGVPGFGIGVALIALATIISFMKLRRPLS